MKPRVKTRVNLEAGYAEGSGRLVQIGDRVVPATIEVHFLGLDGNPELRMTIDSTSGAPRCTDLRISSVEAGREVRTKDIRAVKVDDWVETIVPLLAFQVVDEDDGEALSFVLNTSNADAYDKARKTLNAARSRSRRRLDDLRHLARVAAVYRQAEPPRHVAVQRAFDVSESTAFRYIKAAKEAEEQGLLRGAPSADSTTPPPAPAESSGSERTVERFGDAGGRTREEVVGILNAMGHGLPNFNEGED